MNSSRSQGVTTVVCHFDVFSTFGRNSFTDHILEGQPSLSHPCFPCHAVSHGAPFIHPWLADPLLSALLSSRLVGRAKREGHSNHRMTFLDHLSLGGVNLGIFEAGAMPPFIALAAHYSHAACPGLIPSFTLHPGRPSLVIQASTSSVPPIVDIHSGLMSAADIPPAASLGHSSAKSMTSAPGFGLLYLPGAISSFGG